MFERSEFLTLPIFVLHNWEAEGQWQRGRLSLLPFFGEAKKGSGCRATPDQQTDQPHQNTNQQQKNKKLNLLLCQLPSKHLIPRHQTTIHRQHHPSNHPSRIRSQK